MTANGKPVALIAGATGLVGRECVRLLAADYTVAEVRALVRRPLPLSSANRGIGATARVRECLVDFERLDRHADYLHADWVFCALGTTMRQAGSHEAFRRVDFDYPLAIAGMAREQGATHFLLVSAKGASAHSLFFYNRVKGELEDALRSLGYPALTIARPSLLLGERDESRAGEQLAKRLGGFAPPSWRPVHASQVAAALVDAAHTGGAGVRILENSHLRSIP